MESAKSTVKSFLSKSGKHDTTVHQTTSPAIQHETVAQTQHERQTTAVDKEVHQDHYHTTEQPISHSEVLPEQHHHNALPTEHRQFEHDDSDRVKSRLAEEQSKYRDHSERVDGERTTSSEPTVGGEHVHHHVHENIQPVIQKQTVEPHVVHTTKPVHEVHHNESQHHATQALPAMSMGEFQNQGGSLQGHDEKLRDQFDGCPPDGMVGHDSHSHGNSTSTAGAPQIPPVGSSTRDTSSTTTSGNTNDSSMSDNIGSHRGDGGFRDSSKHSGTTSGATPGATSGATSSTTKPSFMDKLNPSKDSNGDGTTGFMK